jgi:predicted pyridoxine 5'-phosphate oxidase superfamily flavin-nucleotide-binding protein
MDRSLSADGPRGVRVMVTPGTPSDTPPPLPWHHGELAIQNHVGDADRMAEIGRRTIRPFLIEQHRDFFPLLAFVVIGAVDPDGDTWATVRCGYPGFAHSPDPLHLRLAAHSEEDDPAQAGMADGDAIGLLGIDLATRRRNRLNGRIEGRDEAGFSVAVVQSFGNCPQYIQRRAFDFHRPPELASPDAARHMDRLDARAVEIIAASDCFFVASYVDLAPRDRQVDVSHRGGRPGFVRIEEDDTLTIPDYPGNHFFSTLGNILLNCRVGLIFIDFDTGDLLQISGDAEVDLERPDYLFGIAERMWRVKPRRIVYRPRGLPLRWDDIVRPERGD